MDNSLDQRLPQKRDNSEPDLSEYKKIVLEKEKFQKILENKVKELDRSNKELEEFAYVASHDLQEPLRKITSFSERLKEKLPDNLEPEVQIYLDRMLAATDNMRTLIDNLLEFSRISRTHRPFEKTNLNHILSEVKADLELKIEESQAAIRAGNLPEIDAIPMQMRQLFTNLFTNAIKFRQPDKQPTITITSTVLTEKEKEERQLPTDKEMYEITIRDNGIGFDQEYSEKIFQIFQRLHGKSEYPGSGIGLSICKKIIDNHQGEIFARGEVANGAVFTLILPASQT